MAWKCFIFSLFRFDEPEPSGYVVSIWRLFSFSFYFLLSYQSHKIEINHKSVNCHVEESPLPTIRYQTGSIHCYLISGDGVQVLILTTLGYESRISKLFTDRFISSLHHQMTILHKSVIIFSRLWPTIMCVCV